MRSLQEFNWLKMNQKNWVQDGDFKPSCPNDRILRIPRHRDHPFRLNVTACSGRS